MNEAEMNDDLMNLEQPHADFIGKESSWAGRHGDLREESSIVALGLSPRVTRALEEAGIRQIADLAEVTAADLMGFDGFDEEALVELEERLDTLKLRLAEPIETTRWQRQSGSREAEERERERVDEQSERRPARSYHAH